MNRKKNRNWINPSVSRRTFMRVSGVLASTAMASQVFNESKVVASPAIAGNKIPPPDGLETAEDIIYTVCQMCHSRCGVRAKVMEGVLVKLDGNPYHPNNRDVIESGGADRLPCTIAPEDAVTELGRMCLKGQAGVQTVYDPYRIQHPLKRVGPRNSGQWQTISWEQAFSEIADEINRLIPRNQRNQYIDPSRPELGPKKNQLAFAPGRSVEKEMSERIWKHGWGTANYGLSHTSVCESTRHVANELITWDPDGSKNSRGAGRTAGWQVDILGSEYIIFFGANPLEADFPMVGMARNLMHFNRNGGKYVVVDPRFNNTAAKAHQWVPITPGADAALAMGMIRWIIANEKHDWDYLANPNREAAQAGGEATWTDSTYLVGTFTDAEGKQFQRYITAGEVGISNGLTVQAGDYVVRSGGLKGHREVGLGELDVTEIVVIDGAPVEAKSAFTLLEEAAFSKTLDEYSSLCEVPKDTIVALAREFVSHGKKAAAMTYRGPIKHTNGFYNQLAIQHLNTLIGNYDWKGGCTAGAGGWGHKSGVVDLGKVEGDPGHTGIRIDRAKTFYDQSEAGSLFTGYPAKRPWFPFGTHGNYQEVIPSIRDSYPYEIKVLITYWNAWPYSVPTLKTVWEQTMSEMVAGEYKLPLLVTISPVMGEVAAWADYVLPDTVYLEKFGVPGIPWRVNKGTAFQRPVVGEFDGEVVGAVGGAGNTIPLNGMNDYTPALPDTKAVLDIQIGLAKALGLDDPSGTHAVGDGALRDSAGNSVGDLHNSWDWAYAILRNIAENAQADHPHLQSLSTEQIVSEILSRGGVFDSPGDEYTGEYLTYPYGNIIRMFVDPVATTKDSVTGEYYSGVPHYKPVVHSDGTAIMDSGYDLRLITYKTVHHGQARTNVNPWLMLITPENPVEISAADAQAMEIETGDVLRVSSSSNPEGVVGKALVTQRLKPGVVAISHHYGHWEQGSQPMEIDGVMTEFDPSRGAGIQPNPIMRTDKLYSNVSLQEPIGASCSFFDTWVKVTKI